MSADAGVERAVLEHDGGRLAYAVRGSGPPVLFIQGVGVRGDGWLPQVEELAPGRRCLWFDNRGVGDSVPAAPELTVARMAADVRALARAQGWASFHAVGHSLGGLVALRLALEDPGAVRSLALLCTFARGRDAGASMRMMWIGARTRIGTRRMRRHAFLEILAPPPALRHADRDGMAADFAPFFGHDLADHPAVEAQQLAAMRAEDATARLSALAGIPTLVVSAEHDPIAPPSLGEAIARGIPGARFELLRDAAHGVTIQAPERVSRLLAEHIPAGDHAR